VTEWFEGDASRNDLESAFVRRLREEASSWQLPDLSPTDTSVVAARTLVPLVIEVDVPGLPQVANLCRTLRIGFWSTTRRAPAIEGEWGDAYFFDNYNGNDPECLTVRGIDSNGDDLASMSAHWLLKQLRRNVEREDWLSHGELFASRWRLADTGHVLGKQGSWLRRRIAGKPDRVIPVRPS